jgi:acetyl/propionyl-CoA carboxylase alpha subunit
MRYFYQAGNTTYEVQLERHGDGYRATIDGATYDLEVLDSQPGALSLSFGTGAAPIHPEVVYWGAEGDVRWLSWRGCTYRLERPTRRRSRTAPGAAPEDSLRAPMPAQVRDVAVAPGDEVQAGQTLMLLEAMKMEIRLASPRRGRVARLFAKTGDTVDRDQVLVELEREA